MYEEPLRVSFAFLSGLPIVISSFGKKASLAVGESVLHGHWSRLPAIVQTLPNMFPLDMKDPMGVKSLNGTYIAWAEESRITPVALRLPGMFIETRLRLH